VLIINEGRIVADDTPGRLTERFGSTHSQEIEMLLRGEITPTAIESMLGAVAGVDQVVVTSEGDELWRAIVSGASPGLREEVTRAAVEGGLGVREVQARRLTLEDVFLSLTAEEEDTSESLEQ
jgi:ABC-type multidrug transport system ATPase subunit